MSYRGFTDSKFSSSLSSRAIGRDGCSLASFRASSSRVSRYSSLLSRDRTVLRRKRCSETTRIWEEPQFLTYQSQGRP